jgi:hypothetical protein
VSSLLRGVVCSPQSSLLVSAVVHAQPVTRAEHDNSGRHTRVLTREHDNSGRQKSSVMPLQSTIKQLLKGGKPILCSQPHMLPNMAHNNPSSYPEQLRTGQACYNRHASGYWHCTLTLKTTPYCNPKTPQPRCAVAGSSPHTVWWNHPTSNHHCVAANSQPAALHHHSFTNTHATHLPLQTHIGPCLSR